MKTEITLGFVLVSVPMQDCEGTNYTIQFRRVGKRISRTDVIYHWPTKKYIKEAYRHALAAINRHNASGGEPCRF